MRKIFKMANAELSKIFMRPSMFVLFGVLVVALVISFLFFNPESTSTKFEYSEGFTSRIYTNFQNDYESLEQSLVDAKNEIFDFMSDDNDTCELFKVKFRNLDWQFGDVLYNDILSSKKPYPTSEQLDKITQDFTDFKESVRNVKNFMLENIKDKNTNLFITNADYEKIYKSLNGIIEIIPSETQLNELTITQIMERYNLIKDSFDVHGLRLKADSLEKIEIDEAVLQELLDKYYYSSISETSEGQIEYTHTGRLKELYDEIDEYYAEVGETSDNDKVAKLNNKIANFYDYIQISSALVSKNFEVLRIGNKSDDEISYYNGFSGISTYQLKYDIVAYKYFYENNTHAYEYSKGFNYNVNSGTDTTAYDFSFYALQILSALIIIFVIFFACGSISGEQVAGTLKMVAIRPFTRNKIYSGKFLACFNVASLLILLSFVASFVVGIAMFGFSAKPMLIIINASSVIVTSPIVVMLLYFASILIDTIFYISLALLISMLIKQTVISTAITSAVFITSTIITGITNSSFIRFVPSLNTGLFKFITQSKIGLFSFNVVPNVTLWSSVLVLVGSVMIFDLMGRLLFTHRSLDK